MVLYLQRQTCLDWFMYVTFWVFHIFLIMYHVNELNLHNLYLAVNHKQVGLFFLQTPYNNSFTDESI